MATTKLEKTNDDIGLKNAAYVKKHGLRITYVALVKILLNAKGQYITASPITTRDTSIVDVYACCTVNGDVKHLECVYSFQHNIAYGFNPPMEDLLLGAKEYIKDNNAFAAEQEAAEQLEARHEDAVQLWENQEKPEIVGPGYDFRMRGRHLRE